MKNKNQKMLERLTFYSIGNKKEMKKGLDSCFLHYGIRQEDMRLIEEACQQADIDAEWVKEYILKPYNEERNNETLDEKRLRGILNKALKKIV